MEGHCSRAKGQEPAALGGGVPLLRKAEVTLSVPFPIPPAPGDTLVPCKAVPALGPAAVAIPTRCSASPVSPCPAGWGPSVLVSPAKGLLHLSKPPDIPPSRLSAWPAPMLVPSPGFPSMGLGWGLGACGVVEAKQCLHLLEKRALGRFSASAPQNSTPHGSQGTWGGSWHPPHWHEGGWPWLQNNQGAATTLGLLQPLQPGPELSWE